VVVDGILNTSKYGAMLRCLVRDHVGVSTAYLWDVPLEETVRRHATKPVAADFGEAELREWYHPRHLVPGLDEVVLGAEVTADAALARIRGDAGL